MSAGRDVRGIKRGHQFDKVEMVKFVEPSTSDAELFALLDDAEDVCRRLGIPHRVVQMCTGDLSFTAAMKYDVELWAPGCGEWLEVSSCSNFRDFQARRANIRYRPAPQAKPELVHTLNGSGLALPRVVIGVLETYQQADGTVVDPGSAAPLHGRPRPDRGEPLKQADLRRCSVDSRVSGVAPLRLGARSFAPSISTCLSGSRTEETCLDLKR